MGSIGHFLINFVQNFIAFVFMIIFGIISFFFTVFIVDYGATMAGYAQNEYVVLTAGLLVAAAILSGGISPLGHLNPQPEVHTHEQPESK